MEEPIEDQQIQSDSESDIIEKIKAQPKVKKPRSQKQQEAWLRCKEARARKVADKKTAKKDKEVEQYLERKKKTKKKRVVVQSSSESEEESEEPVRRPRSASVAEVPQFLMFNSFFLVIK